MKRIYGFCLIFFMLLLFYNERGFCQKIFSIQNFTTKNGLPENNVQSILLDKNEFLWASYGNGLLRFDGQHFRKFLASATPYISLYIYKTFSDDMLVLDASGSVFKINNQREDTLRLGNVNSLNYLIIKGTLPGKDFYMRYTTPHVNKSLDRNWFYSPLYLFSFSEKEYAIRTKKGVAFYNEKTLEKEINLESYSPREFLLMNGNIYFFSQKNELFYIDRINRKIELCNITGDLPKNKIFINASGDVFNTYWDYNNSDPCLLIGYSLYHLKADHANPIQIGSEYITNEIPHNCLINSLIYNSKNHLLVIATDTKGIFVFKEKTFKTLTYENPEAGSNNAYYCQLDLDSNTLFTDWKREFTINGGRKSHLPVNKNYSENIFRDRHGNLWYQEGTQLIKYNPATGIHKRIINPSKQFALCYYEEGDSLWLGTYTSISCVINDTLRVIYKLNNNSSNSNLFQIFRWNDNKLWFCNYTGIYRFDNQNKQIDTLKPLYNKYPYNITFYKDYMMIGTYGRGYYFYQNGKTVRMPEDKNNSLQQVHSFVNDEDGYTWMATNNGIFKTRLKDLTGYFNDTTYQVMFIHYGEEDGIESTELNGGCLPSHIILKNGYVSLPAVDGLVWFKPHEVYESSLHAPIIIDAVYRNGIRAGRDSVLKLASATDLLRIEFCTSYWGKPENLILEYKLEGYNKQWTAVNIGQSSVEFPNLPSGNYVFEIRKKSGFDPSDYILTRMGISVAKIFYEKIEFLLLCVLLAILFVTGVARLYAFNIRKKNKVLELSVLQRTMELSKANEALHRSVNIKDKLISIISHDVVTPLRFITLVAGKGADKTSALTKENIQDVLFEIKNSSRKLHDNAQNILNWIKHQNNRFKIHKSNVAVSAVVDEISDIFKEIAGTNRTQIINTVSDEDIIQTDKNILSIILHNLLSNATKFTVNGTITISSINMESRYSMIIEDTGSGMSPDQLNRIKQIILQNKDVASEPIMDSQPHGYGLGYIIITELIELLQGQLSLESSPGTGTKITITLS